MDAKAFSMDGVIAAHAAGGDMWHEFLRVPELSMGLYVIAAGGDDPQSPHNEDEVYYIVSGRGILTAGDQEYPAEPGSILFVAKQVPHKFHDVTEELRVLVKGFEEQQREEQKKILEEEKRIPELKPGSPDRKELEKKIFQMKTDLAAGAKIKQAEFMEREAKIYFHTYTAIQEEVAYYCQVKGVAVVISYNSEKADQNSRQSIMRAMTEVRPSHLLDRKLFDFASLRRA